MATESPRRLLSAGVRAQLPAVIAFVPFGLVTGVAGVSAGLTPFETIGMSVVVSSGVVQIVAAQLYGVGAPILVILLTAAILNLRLVMYSAGLAPWLAHLPLRWKCLIAYLLTDTAYALSVVEFTQHPTRPNKEWFILGTGVVTWPVWQATVAVGAFFGAQIPSTWSLEFAFPLVFVALLASVLPDRPSLVAALVGGSAAIVTYFLPHRLGLVAAALLGIGAARFYSLLERRWSGK